MSNYESSAVVCPFFRKPKEESKNKIRCEGFGEVDVCELVFSHTRKKKDWMKSYCFSFRYLRCPHAKMLDDMWEAKK